MDFAVLADDRVKLKESEKKISTWTLLEIWKKLWNMKVTVISVVIGVLGTVTEGLIKGLVDGKKDTRNKAEIIKFSIQYRLVVLLNYSFYI